MLLDGTERKPAPLLARGTPSVAATRLGFHVSHSLFEPYVVLLRTTGFPAFQDFSSDRCASRVPRAVSLLMGFIRRSGRSAPPTKATVAQPSHAEPGLLLQ